MSFHVKPDTAIDDDTARLLRRIKQRARTQQERAALFGWTPRYQRMIEHGRIPHSVLAFIRAGVLAITEHTDDAHETND